jgi:dTDP-4-dehydrorhamnose reductase
MSIELWGGHEATLNRVGNRFFDQTKKSGHQSRLSDIADFAKIGIRALRYPVLWEQVAPDKRDEADFSWSDERIAEIKRVGMRPIIGLVHHGSGPAYTNLLDRNFASGLADHARMTAERYPWVTDWTPVNEPLTTARFSCLYGLWYPHRRDEGSCWEALLNQIDAIRLSMREIRKIIPAARLIQTEDLGYCHATRPLATQAAFENERRWLSWDLLFGRVVRGHPLYERLCHFGMSERLRAIADEPCPPNLIGINHYLSSERFIDHRMDLYPDVPPAGDGEETFANIDAVRILKDGLLGPGHLIPEAWNRYQSPIAVTECHNGCTREEQMRWFWETWTTAERLYADGIPIEAVTAWALLGSYDWNHLVVSDAGFYEPGIFDVRSGTPRPTGMARLLNALAAKADPKELCTASPGWWRRDTRLLYPQGDDILKIAGRRAFAPRPPQIKNRPILIVGQTGTLGKALAASCSRRGLHFVLTGRETLALESKESARRAFIRFDPWMVINAAGWVKVDEAESYPEMCMSANAMGAETLAVLCAEHGLPLTTFSSDQVFDGVKGGQYTEEDQPNPLNVYGLSKAEAERRIAETGVKALIIRTAAFFSPYDRYKFAVGVVNALQAQRKVEAAYDEFVSPTYVPDLVDAVLDLALDGEQGIWHLANQGRVSWLEFACMLAERAGLQRNKILPIAGKQQNRRANRPADVALSSSRGLLLPSLDHAVNRFVGNFLEACDIRNDGKEYERTSPISSLGQICDLPASF